MNSWLKFSCISLLLLISQVVRADLSELISRAEELSSFATATSRESKKSYSSLIKDQGMWKSIAGSPVSSKRDIPNPFHLPAYQDIFSEIVDKFGKLEKPWLKFQGLIHEIELDANKDFHDFKFISIIWHTLALQANTLEKELKGLSEEEIGKQEELLLSNVAYLLQVRKEMIDIAGGLPERIRKVHFWLLLNDVMQKHVEEPPASNPDLTFFREVYFFRVSLTLRSSFLLIERDKTAVFQMSRYLDQVFKMLEKYHTRNQACARAIGELKKLGIELRTLLAKVDELNSEIPNFETLFQMVKDAPLLRDIPTEVDFQLLNKNQLDGPFFLECSRFFMKIDSRNSTRYRALERFVYRKHPNWFYHLPPLPEQQPEKDAPTAPETVPVQNQKISQWLSELPTKSSPPEIKEKTKTKGDADLSKANLNLKPELARTEEQQPVLQASAPQIIYLGSRIHHRFLKFFEVNPGKITLLEARALVLALGGTFDEVGGKGSHAKVKMKKALYFHNRLAGIVEDREMELKPEASSETPESPGTKDERLSIVTLARHTELKPYQITALREAFEQAGYNPMTVRYSSEKDLTEDLVEYAGN